MEKMKDSYINTSKNGPIINYLINESLPSKKIDTEVKLLTDLTINKYKKSIDNVKNSRAFANDEVKVAYFSFLWDIPIDETILTIKYIKLDSAKNKIN